MDNVLKMKAKHFKGTDFESNGCCALCKAAREQFNATNVNASTTYIELNDATFLKLDYTYRHFLDDMKIAEGSNYSDKVVRELKIKQLL